MALLVERVMRLSDAAAADEEVEELDDQYFDLVPQDSLLMDAFLRKLAMRLEAFASCGEGR